METYKVRYYQDNNYQVVKIIRDSDNNEIEEESCFTGSLSDCEAYIRLKQNGLM